MAATEEMLLQQLLWDFRRSDEARQMLREAIWTRTAAGIYRLRSSRR